MALLGLLLFPACCTAEETLCRSGEYLTAGGACAVCPDGQYQDTWEHAETSCKTCAAGSYSKGDEWYQKGNCSPCDAGTYQPEPGKSECLVCPDGMAAEDEGQTSCKTCGPGTYTKGTSGWQKTRCEECEAGSVQPGSGKSGCTICADGWYQDESAQTTCKKCSPGSYSKGELSFEKSRCSLCDAGTVQPLGGQSKCSTCKDGQWQDRDGQTACKTCRPGTYTKGPYDFQHAAEMKCDEGTYQPKPGQSACLKCPGRTFQPARGATACRPCRPGNVLDSLKTACTPCAPGTVQPLNKVASNACYYCDLTFWQNLPGQTACRACPAGTAVMDLGGKSAAACKPFLAGNVSFSEALEQNWQINGRRSKYVAQAVPRAAVSGRLHSTCARLMMDGKQKSLCQDFSVFILPNRATRIRYQTRSGGQADCTIPAGRSSAKCLIYFVSEEIGSQKFEGTEHVIISGFKATLGRQAGKLAGQPGAAAPPVDPVSTVANFTAPLH